MDPTHDCAGGTGALRRGTGDEVRPGDGFDETTAAAGSDTRPDTAATGPLRGTLVVDLSRALAGPHATMMLADLGARVIKVEAPSRGDDSRGWGPPFVDPADGDRESTYFLSANRDKESITLDLKNPADHAVLAAMISRADVLVENFRAGVMERLGFGADVVGALNPRLIVLSITGFGHDGPEGGRAGYDQIAQGEAGLMSLTGPDPEHPQKVGVPIADLLAGMYGAYGVLAALRERSLTGRGQVVRTSLLAAVIGVHAFQGTRWTVGGQVGHAAGNHHASIAPYGLFRCADGFVQIAVGSEKLWLRFCDAFDLDPAADGFATNAERVTHRDDTIALVERAFSTWTQAGLLHRLDEIGIPAGRVRTLDEVYAWDQVASQGLVIDVDHDTLGRLRLPGPPLRFFGYDGAEHTRVDHRPPPVLNGDGTALRAEFAGAATPGNDSTDNGGTTSTATGAEAS